MLKDEIKESLIKKKTEFKRNVYWWKNQSKHSMKNKIKKLSKFLKLYEKTVWQKKNIEAKVWKKEREKDNIILIIE